LINVKGVDKFRLGSAQAISDAVAAFEGQLGNTGRILLRPSGTEALVRVMVEAQSIDKAEKIAEDLATLVRSELAQ
jgi:phosphoglucosamine mutase